MKPLPAPPNYECNTPRGVKRACTLERSKDRFPWMHSRRSMGLLDGKMDLIKKDKEKSKILKKLIRTQKKKLAGHTMSDGIPSITLNTSKGLGMSNYSTQ